MNQRGVKLWELMVVVLIIGGVAVAFFSFVVRPFLHWFFAGMFH